MNTLKTKINDAIQRNTSQEKYVNIFLSGGLDSSTIVSFIDSLIKSRMILPEKIKTYSIGFDTDNEFNYATLVSDFFKTEHVNITTNTDEYLENMIDLVYFKGSPLNVPNEPLIYTMSKKVKETGNVVL